MLSYITSLEFQAPIKIDVDQSSLIGRRRKIPSVSAGQVARLGYVHVGVRKGFHGGRCSRQPSPLSSDLLRA